MARVTEISVDRLQQALDGEAGSKPTLRLTAAIAYKHGVSQTELAEWFGVRRRTIHRWLKRLEEEPIEQAVRDDRRTGRPRKLDGDQRSRLDETLQRAPTDVGYDAPAWSPPLVKRYLEETFDVAYSLPSCRRLLKEAGLSYRKPLNAAATTDDEATEGIETDPGVTRGAWTPR